MVLDFIGDTMQQDQLSQTHNHLSAEEPNPSESLYQVAQILLQQVISLLQGAVITDEQLSFTSELIPGSTIGKHLRHTHDHFRLLLDSLSSPTSSSNAPLTFSYDTRSRELKSETSHQVALDSFADLMKRFEVETDEGRRVQAGKKVLLEAVTPDLVELESSWARELWFACLHATHHFALLRVIAAGELNISIPPDFGVAPSTLAARASSVDAPPKL